MGVSLRGCIAYILDPDTTLTFDLKVKFIGFLTCFRARPVIFYCFDIGLPYFTHWCITMRGCVAYILDPDTTLTFDLKVKFKEFLTLCSQIYLLVGHKKLYLR